MQVAAAMDADQSELNVGVSATRGLTELRRLERAQTTGGMEDLVERIQAKVRIYRNVGSARGDILRVWPLTA